MQNIKIYSKPEILAESIAEILYNQIHSLTDKKGRINIVLSGGSTPKLLFRVFAEYYAQKIKWNLVHIFWGDERCVPPFDDESNYLMTKQTLLDSISIPDINIHRIRGENNPFLEAERYSTEILANTEIKNGLPYFDIILLGLGEDGHTASIFPDQKHLLTSEKICETAFHPVTKQSRITITGRIINNSDNILFLVSGKSKAEVVKKILIDKEGAELYPAYHICSDNGVTSWHLDEDAAILLKN